MIVTCPDCATRYDVDESAFAAGGRAVRCHHCGCEWYQIGPASAARGGPASIGGFEPVDTNSDGWSEADAIEETSTALSRVGSVGAGADLPETAGSTLEASALAAPTSTSVSRVRADDLDATAAETISSVRPTGRSGGAERPSSRLGAIFGVGALVLGLGGVVGAYVYQDATLDAPVETADPVVSDPTPPPPTELAEPAPNIEPTFAGGNGFVLVEHRYDLVELPQGPALLVWGRIANNSDQRALTPLIQVVSRTEAGTAIQRWYARPEVESLDPGESTRFSSRMMFPTPPVAEVDLYLANP